MPNESTLPDAISLILSWMPLLLMAGVMLLAFSRAGYLRRGAMTHGQYREECLNEIRRQNAVLAALLTKMDAPLLPLEADVKKQDT
jgi:hypothetical protein